MERLHVVYRGRVQGVWFRANCQKKAVELGVLGWVRNMPDGSVESIAEGERDTLEKLLEWNIHHQPMARVDSTEATWGKPTGEFRDFRIIR
ncbi:MAG: acylphosphatase [Thermoplasmatota archaeon]